MKLLSAVLAAAICSAAQAKDYGSWIGSLPDRFASGAEVPSLDVAAPNGVLVEGDFARFEKVWARLERGEAIRIGVIGGSITQGACASTPDKRWGETLAAGWRRAFPKAKIDFFNAGIGATGSVIGSFRLRRDVLVHKPDVVAVEFSVNDSADRMSAEAYEGVVRQLLSAPGDVAVILLGMVGQAGNNVQSWHAQVARHYGLPYMSYRDAIYYPYVKDGRVKWTDISPDTIHPNDVGHAFAAALVNWRLKSRYDAWTAGGRKTPSVAALPAPLFGRSFEQGEFVLMKDAHMTKNEGFFPLRDGCWGSGLACTNANGRLVFEVEGSTVALLYRLGREPYNWGKMSVKVDGREVHSAVNCYRDQWWWYTPALFLCKGQPGRHIVEVTALADKDPASKGYGCHLTGLLVSDVAP